MPVDARGASRRCVGDSPDGGRGSKRATPFCSSRRCDRPTGEKSETIEEQRERERERGRREKARDPKKGGRRREGVVMVQKPGTRGSLGLICQISFHASESGRDQLDGARYESADTYRVLSPSPFHPPTPLIRRCVSYRALNRDITLKRESYFTSVKRERENGSGRERRTISGN